MQVNIIPKYVNIEQLSNAISISVNTIYTWVNQRYIPYYKFGKAVRFKVEETVNWLEARKVEPYKH